MLEKLKKLLPDAQDDTLLQTLLDSAEAAILAYTGRTEFPDALREAQLQLAAVYYTRMGMEGETSHGEGSVSRTAEPFPAMIKETLIPYRLAKCFT